MMNREVENSQSELSSSLLAKIFAIAGILALPAGWFLPQPPLYYNQPVQAVVIRKLISLHKHYSKSSTTIVCRPHLTVQYAVNGRKYDSDCLVGPKNIVDQLIGGDYAKTPEQAEKILSPFDDGDALTVYYASDALGSSSVNPELHIGDRIFVLVGLMFLICSFVALLIGAAKKVGFAKIK